VSLGQLTDSRDQRSQHAIAIPISVSQAPIGQRLFHDDLHPRGIRPWLLATTSLNDSQVGFWEPAKWVAKLRAMKTDSNPLYIKINMGGGHGGSSGRYDVLRERAFRYAFMLDAVGMGDRLTP
jgi:hypothetical protein